MAGDHPPPGSTPGATPSSSSTGAGRPDFKFHVYTKTGEPDPDTGYDFGANRDSRKIIAWGGTTADDEETGLGGTDRRVWFYDLSAGPESWTGNWNVDNADLDGDGVPDYRMPPIWEYRHGRLPRAGGAVRRPRQARPLRRAQPAVHPLAALPADAHAAAPAARRSTSTATPTRAGPASTPRAVPEARPAVQELSRAPAASRSPRTSRTCRSRPGAGAATLWLRPDVPCFPELGLPGVRQPVPLQRAAPRRSPGTAAGDYEACCSTTPPGRGRRLLGLRRRQLRRRHPELRLQLRLAGAHRAGLRPDHHRRSTSSGTTSA